MNTTKTLHALSMLRSPFLCTKPIPTKPSRLIGLCRLNQTRLASTGSQLSRDERHGLSNLRGVLTIAIPSLFLTWAVLEYYDPHQRNQHSNMMKRKLLDENKAIGRAHNCAEVHISDVEKWAEHHPEYAVHWQRLREEYERSRK